MALSCFRFKKRAKRNDSMALSSTYEIGTPMAPSTSGINTNPSNIVVKNLIAQLTNELYSLARNKIGGTVIMYHLCNYTADWHATKETFISPPTSFNRPYKPGALKKIFTSKGAEHDGAVIFYLANGLIDSVSAKLFMVKHDCENKCANRGTRHSSACSFSNFTPVPIIVISEEKGQVSLFSNGRAKFGIMQRNLVDELRNAYEKQEESCLAYGSFDDTKFSKYFNMNALFLDMNESLQYFQNWYITNQIDLYKGVSMVLGEGIMRDEEDRTITPGHREHQILAEKCVKYDYADNLINYYNEEEQCLILSHGDKRLGGFFYKIVGKTIVLSSFFLLRQLIHGGFAAQFLREVFWKKMYPHCDSMEFVMPDHLAKPFANLIEALNDNEEPSLRVKRTLTNGITNSVLNAVFEEDDEGSILDFKMEEMSVEKRIRVEQTLEQANASWKEQNGVDFLPCEEMQEIPRSLVEMQENFLDRLYDEFNKEETR